MTASRTFVTVASSPESPGGDLPLHWSYLYAPGHRPHVMRKAFATEADCIVLDLEDAVPPTEREAARREVAAFLDEVVDAPSPQVHVRINRRREGYDLEDVAAVVRPALRGLRLPKAEDPEALTEVASHLDDLEAGAGMARGTIGLYPLVESALGIHRALELLTSSPRIIRAALGTSDLLADLGIPSETREGMLHVRSRLVVESRLAGVGPPIDSVHTDLQDVDGLRAAARWARSLGFVGKSVIHPRQIAPTHAAFMPTREEVDHARAVLERVDAGASRVGDEFVDPAIVARAHAVLRLERTP